MTDLLPPAPTPAPPSAAAVARYLALRTDAAARLPLWGRLLQAAPFGAAAPRVPIVPDALRREHSGLAATAAVAVAARRGARSRTLAPGALTRVRAGGAHSLPCRRWRAAHGGQPGVVSRVLPRAGRLCAGDGCVSSLAGLARVCPARRHGRVQRRGSCSASRAGGRRRGSVRRVRACSGRTLHASGCTPHTRRAPKHHTPALLQATAWASPWGSCLRGCLSRRPTWSRFRVRVCGRGGRACL
jgi:hypothetical protein